MTLDKTLEMNKKHKKLVRKPEGKRKLVRQKRWDNTEDDLKETGYEPVN
jgi:hypothetical protein